MSPRAGPVTDPASGGDVAQAQAKPGWRHWVALSVACATVVLITLDSTILNVALPTMARDLDSSVPTLQWVIAGYSLTVASLLIIGGRLGDLFGHRRMFLIGAGLFGAGSLMAALAQSVAGLIIGESIIEGIGAALMMPASLAILSTTFTGRSRAMAFAVWGTLGGASAAFGPVVGGVLTTNASWRWSFGINVIVAPLAIAGGLLFIPPSRRAKQRPKIDLLGALLVGAGMFLVVLGLSEGAEYGWLHPLRSFSIGGFEAWPVGAPISLSLMAFLTAVVLLSAFVAQEQRLTRADADPLFDLTLLRVASFRYALAALLCMALAAATLGITLPVFLQEGKHLSAQTSGLWQLPIGCAVLIGAQIGARLTQRIGPPLTVCVGMTCSVLGLGLLAITISDGLTFWRLFPALIAHGIGMGFGFSQLNNIGLSEIRDQKMGVASGVASAARHTAAALAVAMVSGLLVSGLSRAAPSRFENLDGLTPAIRAAALESVRANHIGFEAPAGATPADIAQLDHAFGEALAHATRIPLLIASVACVIGFLLVWKLVPRRRRAATTPATALDTA